MTVSTFFLIAFVACGLLDVWVALRALAPDPVRDERGVSLAGVWRACWRVAVLGMLQALLLTPAGLHVFGMMQLAWIVLAYVIPLCGLVVLVGHLRGRHASLAARVVAGVALLAIPVTVSAQFVTPYDLRLETASLALAPARAGEQPLRIGILADLQTSHVGAHERAAVRRLMAQRPDLILVPGDLYQGPGEAIARELPAFVALLEQLQAPGGVWLVPGNADHPEALRQLVEATGLPLLRDEQVELRVRDRRVTLLGLDEVPHGRRTPEGFVSRQHRAVGRLLTAPGDDDIRILLSHRPRVVDMLPERSRVDLVVAGHTHGGQVALPGIGPLLTLSPLPREIGAGGLHRRNGNALYVSRGVGLERLNAPRIRLGVPPEITVLTLSDGEPAP